MLIVGLILHFPIPSVRKLTILRCYYISRESGVRIKVRLKEEEGKSRVYEMNEEKKNHMTNKKILSPSSASSETSLFWQRF